MEGFFADRLEIRYNLEPGGIDLSFPLSASHAKNLEKWGEFSNRVSALVEKTTR
jgi:hypothetical protein